MAVGAFLDHVATRSTQPSGTPRSGTERSGTERSGTERSGTERSGVGRVVARELPADPARWPIRSARGHHLAEIVVSWRDRGFWRAPTSPRLSPGGRTAARPAARASGWRQVVWAVPPAPRPTDPAVPWRLLAETVAELTAAGATHVWFVRKTGLRLRAQGDAEALEPILRRRSEEGVGSGEILRASPAVYEPEVARFGGAAGLALAHDLFHGDTPLALREVQLDAGAAPVLHRMALAVAVVADLITSVVQDRAEVWDVWQQLDALARSNAMSSPDLVASFTREDVAEILAAPAESLAPSLQGLFHDGRGLAATAAARLRELTREGTLHVGERTWLTAAALFAWNRRDLGLHPAELATATATAVMLTAP
jgi:thiopeptide-type bacteriocin biosynthesis protein